MEMKELRKVASEEIELEVTISSQQAGDKSLLHYSAHLVLFAKTPEAPSYKNLDLTESQVIEGESFYQDGTLFHGPTFRTVTDRRSGPPSGG